MSLTTYICVLWQLSYHCTIYDISGMRNQVLRWRSCRVCAHQRWASYTTIVSSTPSSPLHHHHLLYTTIISCTPPSSPLHHHHLLYTIIVSIDPSTSQSSLVEPRTTPAGLQATEPASAPPRTGHTHEDRTCTSTCVLAFCRRPIRDSAEAGSAAWGRVFTRNSRWSVDCMIMSITLNKKWIIIELSHIKEEMNHNKNLHFISF